MTGKIPLTIDILRQLVALPSVSSVSPEYDMGNREVVELLAAWLGDLGFAIELLPIPEDPRKANLVATLGRGEGGLVLAGHTDTVPYDQGLWSSDPFELSERDGRLYGLGTSDMKGFFALVLQAVSSLRATELARPLVILATADEESGMTGAKALVAAGRRLGRYAVIGEPTGLRPMRAHKGVMMEAIRIIGKSGHSSDPTLGVNAIEGLARVLDALLAWRLELQDRYRNTAFSVPVPTMNLGHVHGGDNPNRICGEAELHIDLRPLPGMDLTELRDALRRRVAAALEGGAWRFETRSLFSGLAALETSVDAEIVRAAESLTGCSAGSVGFGTEGPFFTSLGMEVVVMGPGDIDQAHQPDEYIRIDRFKPTVDLLGKLIDRFCRSDAESRLPEHAT